MDARVSLGSLGYPVVAGRTYRFVAWLSNAAFGLPWNSPSTDDLTSSVRAVLPDATVLLPWDALPTDWPAESVGMPGNEFFVRAEGTWKGDGRALSPTVPVAGTSEPLHIAAVWTHTNDDAAVPDATPTPDATPVSPPPAAAPSASVTPTPSAAPPRAPPAVPSPSASPPAASPPAARAPRRRGTSALTKVFLGAGTFFGLVLVFAHPPRRRRAA